MMPLSMGPNVRPTVGLQRQAPACRRLSAGRQGWASPYDTVQKLHLLDLTMNRAAVLSVASAPTTAERAMFTHRPYNRRILHTSFGSATSIRHDDEIKVGDTVQLKADSTAYEVVVRQCCANGSFRGTVNDIDPPGAGTGPVRIGSEVAFAREQIH